jgi:FkbH-like protein
VAGAVPDEGRRLAQMDAGDSSKVYFRLRLIEALEINSQRRSSGGRPFRISLACGFMPLHLGDFLQAHLNLAFPDRNVVLEAGLYGDICGNVERALQSQPDSVAIVIEWQDLDARLGVRQLGGWTPDAADDIVAATGKALDRIGFAISESANRGTVAICPPTLPLPPFSHEPGWQTGAAELSLRLHMSGFLTRVSQVRNVRLASSTAIDRISPLADRFDLHSEIGVGFPYKRFHADAVSQVLALLISNPVPKKGLITDLDDTVWRGILGEVGPEEVRWDLSSKAQIHGIYQQFLMALAARGVLLAVVSKNDPALVEQAFLREDLVLKRGSIYPVEAGWGRKSEAVSRVLKSWNISADSVIFVDDSPMELEEVKSAHPEIETHVFPAHDPAAAWGLISILQDRFGKTEVREEDRVRLSSLRNARQFGATDRQPGAEIQSEDSFLAQAEAIVTIDTRRDAVAGRALELINKTNQFNLNGRRMTDAEWDAQLADPATFLQVVSYRDKYGPLGIVAVVSGRAEGEALRLNCWVMSCRAFARRIEYQCLRALFERSGATEVCLDYRPTARNQPVHTFLTALADDPPDGAVRIGRGAFLKRCPALFHEVNIR